MNLLAEANKATPGRWVLMPRKGQPFMDPPNRRRARVRRRRRQIFVVLVDVTGLALLMGLFPPFRMMLGVGAVLLAVLAAYCLMLLKIRADETRRARHLRSLRARYGESYLRADGTSYRYDDAVRGIENGNGHAYANGIENGHGHGNGHAHGNGYAAILDALGEFDIDERYLTEGGVTIIDDDVHVVIRRSDEIDVQALRDAQ